MRMPPTIASGPGTRTTTSALFNHILASQHPSGGFVYFTPMRPNHYRVYSPVHLGVWCCVGSGLESHARHGQFVYSRVEDTGDGPALFVNLFVSSSLDWREQGLRLSQHTPIPRRGGDAPAHRRRRCRRPRR